MDFFMHFQEWGLFFSGSGWKLFRSELVKIQTTSPDNVSALPQFNTIKNSLYRTRNEKYPPLPKSIDDVKLEVIDNSSPRYLCFGTTDALKLLCDPEHIFMDGTFKSCPSPFAQIKTKTRAYPYSTRLEM
ncbi:unnamed protein product [Didymodactylos carnosus]|uniref:Uncharacterized protein n=1 Tax=Didymodactylos carnosus TaxID=1234261 RepID=A0A814PZM9_9BILA|nr:unnamed protein product [Didymodactylos carnosus]CAF3876843.1 unnamed protein product [Didymodactylos carnosus]